ncbi:MAG: N-acetylmuramidase family protein [Bacteroidetes bacterium]|nr:N-acetylmuramidase family protein [Bacteroidota bacterium]
MITEEQFMEAAQLLKCEPAAIKAINSVEAGGNGFRKDGKPKILFEGHIFWKQLLAVNIDPVKKTEGNEDILYPTWVISKVRPFYALDQYDRLERAKRIHTDAALKSASWGAFQIMGFNFAKCGFKSVQDFVSAQTVEYQQLKAFCNYIKSVHLDVNLQQLDWRGFARSYNGPDYTQNHYDIKLQKAYEKFKSN